MTAEPYDPLFDLFVTFCQYAHELTTHVNILPREFPSDNQTFFFREGQVLLDRGE